MLRTIRLHLLTLTAIGIGLGGCGDNGGPVDPVDAFAPAAPVGLITITGDGNVTLIWRSNLEPDIEAYNTYWSFDGSTFNLMATTADTNYVDMDVRNGETVYYAVSAFNIYGNESELSYATFDTPRPAGYDVELSDAETSPSSAGFSFTRGLLGQGVISSDSQVADFFFFVGENDGIPYIQGGNSSGSRTSLILMWGPTVSFADMNYAPDPDDPGSGYQVNGVFQALEGYTYVLLTADGNYAQVRITNVVGDTLIFDWAYQTDPGNPELGPRVPGPGVRD